MEIKSNKCFNRSLLIEGNKVEFDGRGIANVSKELGALIKDQYDTVINTPKAIKVVDENVSDDKLKAINADLTSQNNILTERLDTSKVEIGILKEDVENWKEQYTKATETTEDNETQDSEVSEQDIKVIIDLMKNNKGDLETIATQLNLPTNEWGEFNKEDLVLYLAYKTINANS